MNNCNKMLHKALIKDVNAEVSDKLVVLSSRMLRAFRVSGLLHRNHPASFDDTLYFVKSVLILPGFAAGKNVLRIILVPLPARLSDLLMKYILYGKNGGR